MAGVRGGREFLAGPNFSKWRCEFRTCVRSCSHNQQTPDESSSNSEISDVVPGAPRLYATMTASSETPVSKRSLHFFSLLRASTRFSAVLHARTRERTDEQTDGRTGGRMHERTNAYSRCPGSGKSSPIAGTVSVVYQSVISARWSPLASTSASQSLRLSVGRPAS